VMTNGPPVGDVPALPPGTRVLACASSLGRGIDGTHAQFVVVPRWGVVAVPEAGANLSWRELAAMPLSFGTAAGSLDAMECGSGDTVLVRGGTSALGLAAISLAKRTMGCTVLATTRRSSAKVPLLAAGADVVLVEPEVRDAVRTLYPDGVDCALECIGESTLKDTMRCVRRKGVLCQTGALSDVPGFGLHLLGEVPSSVKLTCFESDLLTGATMAPLIGRILEAVGRKALALPLDPAEFSLEQYQDALGFLDSKERRGKVVVTVD
jgi:NADPH:quinone reductase